jgi:hypothetical protein
LKEKTPKVGFCCFLSESLREMGSFQSSQCRFVKFHWVE